MERPKLQVALDLQDLPSALAPLQKAAPHLDVIECGTILCLAEGMHAVRIIRSLFPDKPVLADVRIAEAGSLISKMAFDAGASWVSVVSGATLNTVEAVMKEAAKHPGAEVQIELIDGWTWEQAAAWRDLGVPQVITHRSRDAEAKGALDLDRARLRRDPPPGRHGLQGDGHRRRQARGDPAVRRRAGVRLHRRPRHLRCGRPGCGREALPRGHRGDVRIR